MTYKWIEKDNISAHTYYKVDDVHTKTLRLLTLLTAGA